MHDIGRWLQRKQTDQYLMSWSLPCVVQTVAPAQSEGQNDMGAI